MNGMRARLIGLLWWKRTTSGGKEPLRRLFYATSTLITAAGHKQN